MLKIVLLTGLTTMIASAFMLGAVFVMTFAAEPAPDAPLVAREAAAPQSVEQTAAAPAGSDHLATLNASTAGGATALAVSAEKPQGAAAAASVPAPVMAGPVGPVAATLPAPGPDLDPRVAAPLALGPETYTLSAGAFRQHDDARRFADELSALSMSAQLVGHVDERGAAWSEVTVGPYADPAGAARAAQDIHRAFALAPAIRASEVAK